jgi:hypothetical protein
MGILSHILRRVVTLVQPLQLFPKRSVGIVYHNLSGFVRYNLGRIQMIQVIKALFTGSTGSRRKPTPPPVVKQNKSYPKQASDKISLLFTCFYWFCYQKLVVGLPSLFGLPSVFVEVEDVSSSSSNGASLVIIDE